MANIRSNSSASTAYVSLQDGLGDAKPHNTGKQDDLKIV